MPQPHPPAPLAQRPEPGTQLLEAVQQRQTQCSLQLAQQWVHRRGVLDLQRFCNTELLNAQGPEALAWLQNLLELDGPSGAAPGAGLTGPETAATASSPDTMTTAPETLAVSSGGSLIALAAEVAAEPAAEVATDTAGSRSSRAAAEAFSSEAEPFEAQAADREAPRFQADEDFAKELQARAVAAVDEAFAALAQTFQDEVNSAASLPEPTTAPLSFTIDAAAHDTPAAQTSVPPQPLPVRVGLWPSLRASAASIGAALRSAGSNGQTAAPAQPQSELTAATVMGETLIRAAEPEPAFAEPLPLDGPTTAKAPEPLCSDQGMAADPVEPPTEAAAPDDAPELDAAVSAVWLSEAPLSEAPETEISGTEAATTGATENEATETEASETEIPENEISETEPSTMPASENSPRAGLLQRLRRRIRRPHLPRMTRLRAVMRDCLDESMALLRAPAPELSDDQELSEDDDFNPTLPLEPTQNLPDSEQPLGQLLDPPLAVAPPPSQRPKRRPMALVVSQPPEPPLAPAVRQQPPLSWVIEPPAAPVAAPDRATDRASGSRIEPQQAAWLPSALSTDDTAAAPSADDALAAPAEDRSWEATDTTAATPATPASVSPLQPARSVRKPAFGSDRPAPAPAALSDLRAWLPDRGDLPRAS